MGEDDKHTYQPINTVVEGPDGPELLNDLSQARFDIRVDVGPSYTTQRIEAATAMLDYAKSDPAAMPFMRDVFVENMDWPGARQLAERLKRTIPPEVLGPDEQQQDDPAAMQQAMMDQQQAAVAQISLQEAQAKLAKAQTDAQASQQKMQLDQRKTAQEMQLEAAKSRAQVEKTQAEIERIRAETAAKQAELQAKVMQMQGEAAEIAVAYP